MKVNIVNIQKFLEEQELNGVLVPQTPQIPFDQVYVPMGIDDQGRDLLLQIKVVEEDLSDNYKLHHDIPGRSSSYHTIHFILALPFMVKDEYIGEVARLILLLNKSFGLPGFEFSEVDRLIYFRSIVMATDKLDEMIVLAVIGNLMTYVDTFSKTLQDVAEGKISLADVVKNATK